jgi:RNase P protein component
MAEANAAAAPKQPLFHYTSENALFSILDSGKFWFTSIYHMDDPEELNFGFSVARELFEEAAKRNNARRFCRERAEDGDRKRITELIAFYSVSFGLRDVGKQ